MRHWIFRRSGVASIILCTFFGLRADARRPDPSEPLLDECVSGVLARHGQFDPQWVRYKATVFRAGSVAKKRPETRYQLDAEFAVKGGKKRSWCKVLKGDNEFSKVGSETWHIDDGEVITTQGRDEKTFVITRKREPITAKIAAPLDISGENHVRDALRGWQGKDGTSGMKAVRITNPKGEASVILEWVYPKKNGRSRCSLSPSRGYAVEWYEQYFANGKLARRSSTTDWVVLDGVNFPKHSIAEAAYDAAGKPSWIREIDVTSLELQSKKIPDRLFQVDFPADATIYDVDKKTPIRRTEAAQTHLDEVIKRIELPRTNWWLIGAWSALGAGLAGFGAYLFRRRRRAPVP